MIHHAITVIGKPSISISMGHRKTTAIFPPRSRTPPARKRTGSSPKCRFHGGKLEPKPAKTMENGWFKAMVVDHRTHKLALNGFNG